MKVLHVCRGLLLGRSWNGVHLALEHARASNNAIGLDALEMGLLIGDPDEGKVVGDSVGGRK